MPGTSADLVRSAFELIDEFERATTPAQVMTRLSGALTKFGYTSFLITTSPELIGTNPQPTFLLNGWPDEWTKVYRENGLYKDDPVAAMGRRTVNPYQWSEAVYDRKKSPSAAHVMQTAHDFGLKDGIVVPIVQENGTMAGVSMAGERPEFDPLAKRAIHVISLFAYTRTVALYKAQAAEPKRLLSKREREALSWAAAGKSTWEISMILGISEATVTFHIQRATAKLQAVNRTHAVVNAIRAGEIQI
jgi:LuxR family transcriptional regulator, quorum-sensing system regulator BjaR1